MREKGRPHSGVVKAADLLRSNSNIPAAFSFQAASSCCLVAAAINPGRSAHHRDFMHGAGAFRNSQRSANGAYHGWNKRDRNGATSVGSERRGAVIGLRKRGRPGQGPVYGVQTQG